MTHIRHCPALHRVDHQFELGDRLPEATLDLVDHAAHIMPAGVLGIDVECARHMPFGKVHALLPVFRPIVVHECHDDMRHERMRIGGTFLQHQGTFQQIASLLHARPRGSERKMRAGALDIDPAWAVLAHFGGYPDPRR
jgi:hypothetical protein